MGFLQQIANEMKKEEEARIKTQKKREQEAAKNLTIREKLKTVIVTTGDLKEEYEVIGPVYYQVSNKGLFSSALSEKVKSYKDELENQKKQGLKSEYEFDWGSLWGEFNVGQNEFEDAFYVAVQELRKRCIILGGDAIVSMRQDIDLDTNTFAYFYLQIYGTAVKRK